MRSLALTRSCRTGRAAVLRLSRQVRPGRQVRPRANRRLTSQSGHGRRQLRTSTPRFGRKSLAVSLAIGVDVGGTKIAAGVVDEKGGIIEMVKRPTPAANATKTIEMIADAVIELLDRHEIEAVGIGAAGFIEESRSSVVFAPNL